MTITVRFFLMSAGLLEEGKRGEFSSPVILNFRCKLTLATCRYHSHYANKAPERLTSPIGPISADLAPPLLCLCACTQRAHMSMGKTPTPTTKNHSVTLWGSPLTPPNRPLPGGGVKCTPSGWCHFSDSTCGYIARETNTQRIAMASYPHQNTPTRVSRGPGVHGMGIHAQNPTHIPIWGWRSCAILHNPRGYIVYNFHVPRSHGPWHHFCSALRARRHRGAP